MRMFFAAAAGCLLVSSAGTASANVGLVKQCINTYGENISPDEVGSIDEICRTFLFPPSPNYPAGYHKFSGNNVRQLALYCKKQYPLNVSLDAIDSNNDGICGIFFFPSLPGVRPAEIVVPPPEQGGLWQE